MPPASFRSEVGELAADRTELNPAMQLLHACNMCVRSVRFTTAVWQGVGVTE